jgi:ComF family protein
VGLDSALDPVVAAFEEALDALYPPRCLLCGAAAAGAPACAEHALPLAPSGARCARCAAPLPAGLEAAGRCAACRREAPGFRRLIVLADYRAQPSAREWILALKHGGRRDLAEPLGGALARRWHGALSAEERAGAVFVPVPLHPWRRLERGYDQARLLADFAGAECGVPVVRALARQRPTAVQGSAGAVSRAANVRGAFRLARWPLRTAQRVAAAREVWLVDDVVTSGATLRECARVLRRRGARRVSALAIARAARSMADEPGA